MFAEVEHSFLFCFSFPFWTYCAWCCHWPFHIPYSPKASGTTLSSLWSYVSPQLLLFNLLFIILAYFCAPVLHKPFKLFINMLFFSICMYSWIFQIEKKIHSLIIYPQYFHDLFGLKYFLISTMNSHTNRINSVQMSHF